MHTMKQWYLMLTTREQLLVVLGAIALSGFLLWFVGIKPLLVTHKKLKQQLALQKSELHKMQTRSATIQYLKAKGLSSSKKTTPRNSSRLIDQALKQYGLKSNLKRMQGRNEVTLTLKDVLADQVMMLLGIMETRHHLYVKKMDITPKKSAGKIDITLTIGK